MNFAGIDVGKTGAIGIVDADGGCVAVEDMPFNGPADIDVLAVLQLLRANDVGMAFLEEQRSMPGQGVVSMFGLGSQYGQLKATLLVSQIRFQTFHSTVWKPGIGIPLKSTKLVSRQMALRMWPGVDLGVRADQGRSDAMLIAEYGRRVVTSVLTYIKP